MKSVADPVALATLEARLRALTPKSQRQWGTMTPAEMLCHVGDAFGSVLGRPGGEPGRSRWLLKWVALRSPLRWPHGRPTLREVDPKRDGTRPGDFERDREVAIGGMHAVASTPPAALPARHMIFGAMTAADWHRWAYRHTDHHLRQFGI